MTSATPSVMKDTPLSPSRASSQTLPLFFNQYAALNDTPAFLTTMYASHQIELRQYDALVHKKIANMSAKLADIDVLVGIPFYTEITNIISVLVTLKEVFEQRRQRACLCVIGEFARSDMVESIPLHQLEDSVNDSDNDTDGGSGSGNGSYVTIETFWKSHPKYASKPFTVRALQVVANAANQGRGAHLIIMDADIQFNHWELSAMSLMRALLDPLLALPDKEDAHTRTHAQARSARASDTQSFHPQFPLSDLARPPPASFVLLNAPRSFIADDALIHLFTYLMTYCYTSQHIHQSHGGEFSIHKSLNRAFLADESLVYRGCYCVEAQMVARALLEPSVTSTNSNTSTNTDSGSSSSSSSASNSATVTEYGGYVLEMLMKGKWHAKITLNKLLQMDDKHSARIDLVSEKVFNDALLFASINTHSSPSPMHHRTGGLTKTLNPDPNNQSMKVLCPIATKKELMSMIKQYYIVLLNHQSDSSLPIDSTIVQELIPLLHSQIAKLPGHRGWNAIVSRQGSASHSKPLIVFGADEWAKYTMEILKIYAAISSATTEPERAKEAKQRFACYSANRIVWLLGSLAFLNDYGNGLWGDMHQSMHTLYAPVFRRKYLSEIIGLDQAQVDEVMASENGTQD